MTLQFNPPGYRRTIIVFLVIVLLGLLAVPGCNLSFQPANGSREEAAGTRSVNAGKLPPSPKVGYLAPDFTLLDLKGNQVRLSDLRGKTVFLNFWATWCPPCRAEMPEIEALYQEYNDKDVIIVGIDLLEPENVVGEFVESNGYSWTFVIDTTGEVGNKYRVTGIPASFFVDKDGVIRAMVVGAMTKPAMETQLAKAMR
ncbi:MAG: redoxin domain-containing protein [Chloroflexi bacterium]|nr:redoxin domain-containing protein [Chloroflexota bacterium]